MKKIVVLLLMLSVGNLFADKLSEEAIKRYDIGYYHPERHGLTSLNFNVRIPTLVEKLNNQMVFGKLNDVYFNVSWSIDKTTMNQTKKILVIGMPNGFKEMKEGLKSMIQTRLDFVIPQMLTGTLANFKTTYKKKSYGGMIEAIDESLKSSVTKIEIFFDKSGKMTRFATYGATGKTDTKMTLSTKQAWSKNKWVVDKLIISKYQGIQTTVVTNDFEYVNVDGFGFPKRIKIETVQKLAKQGTQKSDKIMRTVESELVFSDYVVNKKSK